MTKPHVLPEPFRIKRVEPLALPSSGTRAAARLVKGATLEVYAGAPHGLTVTHRERFHADLLAFLKS
ncbi:hypothetical protein ACN47A_18950 [Myxococcus fulvus]|uniref:alpha/beta fold hydrolase n=1 Tax=Myxococcus fulvus TaxID=33 RepID=UPI003B99A0E8